VLIFLQVVSTDLDQADESLIRTYVVALDVNTYNGLFFKESHTFFKLVLSLNEFEIILYVISYNCACLINGHKAFNIE